MTFSIFQLQVVIFRPTIIIFIQAAPKYPGWWNFLLAKLMLNLYVGGSRSALRKSTKNGYGTSETKSSAAGSYISEVPVRMSTNQSALHSGGGGGGRREYSVQKTCPQHG